MLFAAGCGAGLRDWYIAEGSGEGPHKLQGYKALNKEHTHLKIEDPNRSLPSSLASFLLEKLQTWEKRHPIKP